MEDLNPLVLEEPNPERVRWIKRLRQRQGLKQEVSGVPYELFGAHDWPSLVKQFLLARQAAGPRPQLEALFGALGVADYFYVPYDHELWELPTVIERRKSLARTWGKSVRTLERLEEQGALILDYYFQEMSHPRYGFNLIENIHVLHQALRWWMEQRGLRVPEAEWDVDVVPYRIYRAVNLYVNGYPESAHAVAEHGLDSEAAVRALEVRDPRNDG